MGGNLGLMGEYENLNYGLEALKAQIAANHNETKERLGSIDTNLAVLRTEYIETKKKVDNHDKDLNGGDGVEGIKTKQAKQDIKITFLVTGISLAVSAVGTFVMDKFRGK